VNQAQKRVLVNKIIKRFGTNLSGLSFALWGLAFKPNTDDMRDAPSRIIIRALLEAGARIVAHDPVAMHEAQRVLAHDLADHPQWLDALTFVDSPEACLAGADALVIATEWKVFKAPDFSLVKAQLKHPVVFDGRNLYTPQIMAEEGFEYYAVGRPYIKPHA
jgi:UDPglucose 6-dehydrogenase